jgi:hypothetical protein
VERLLVLPAPVGGPGREPRLRHDIAQLHVGHPHVDAALVDQAGPDVEEELPGLLGRPSGHPLSPTSDSANSPALDE